MNPNDVAARLKETLCTYLETAYRISHPAIRRERAGLLREGSVVSQTPFMETTPNFSNGSWLHELEEMPWITESLSELVQYGFNTSKFPLWEHQEQALRKAWDQEGNPQDTIIATGTGSGKTECFYLPILSDILREALQWPIPDGEALPGEWSRRDNRWLHRRRHETRPAAIRAIVLYPMNALVNDQLRRLRKLLTLDNAIKWQNEKLHGNRIYFGRYTSHTMVPGNPREKKRRRHWEEYRGRMQSGWETVGKSIRNTGGWPRLDGPEMLCRWDMQAAPPDILITNYSMLEYMLVRPIEAEIFNKTKDWLAASPNNILTLVLDEAHTYTGARGTEVAFLIARLFDRLNVGPDKIRCIATSASLGETDEDFQRVKNFASNLFGHPRDRFSVIRAIKQPAPNNLPPPKLAELEAFSTFQNSVEKSCRNIPNNNNEDYMWESSERLINELDLEAEGNDSSQLLYKALNKYPRLIELRERTAQNAQAFEALSNNLWNNLGNEDQRRAATSGLLTAGAYARPNGLYDSDTPPLLPSRIHLMFRGLPGLWACINPNCTAAKKIEKEERPCGKLYAEPRIWCECGARVLELFSCRICGLLFLGGVPDEDGRLWPYEGNLESGFQDYDSYNIFAIENPGDPVYGRPEWAEEQRSIHTTAPNGQEDKSNNRPVWIDPRGASRNVRRRPHECPRCNARGGPRREIVEPMRSTGPQSFGVLIEDAFRIQPPRYQSESLEQKQESPLQNRRWFQPKEEETQRTVPPDHNPNKGRKALVFSDGRQDAAILAGNLYYLHARDLFRQILLVVLNNSQSSEVPVEELRKGIFNLSINRGIDPTFGEIERFWTRWEANRHETQQFAQNIIDAYLRREIADRELGVEALGLAQWILDSRNFNLAEIPALSPFNQRETLSLIYAVLRILSGENTILPADRDPQNWPPELVEFFHRRIIVIPPAQNQNALIWEASRNNRLTRYLSAVVSSANLGSDGLSYLMERLWNEYLCGPILASTGVANNPGYGLPITRLALAPLPERILICRSCGYLNAETVKGICIRCHGECDKINKAEIPERRKNYYYNLALHATSREEYPDPFPLKALEHTAQISASEAANRERHFQDQFIGSGAERENHHECRVDILSVTTTMEMGIDIGDLTVVGLHNTPPTVANYQQRAGRAGRRSDGVATVLTYARDRSHDQYYYSQVAEIVSGNVRVPEVHLDNPVIARRHIHALILQRFFLEYVQQPDENNNLLAAFGSVGDFIRGYNSRLDQLKELLARGEFRNKIATSANTVVPNRSDEINQWIDELSSRIERTLESVRDHEDLLEVFIRKGVLPRYAFPVDLVALWKEPPDRFNRGEEVQRDLQIALSEYAPNGEVIIDGWVYTSAGLYTPFVENPSYEPDSWFYECPNCRYIRIHDSAEHPAWSECPICFTPITGSQWRRPIPAIRPKGFRTDWTEGPRKHRGGSRERSGFTTAVQLHAGDTARNAGEQRCSGRLWIHHRTGDLYVVNRGDPDPNQGPGFWICPLCGRSLDDSGQPHSVPAYVQRGQSRRCRGRPTQKAILLHGFRSNVALVAVDFPLTLTANPIYPKGRSIWLSLGTALLRAAAIHLQIDTNELSVGMRPFQHPDGRLLGEIFLYDTLPNGAGYAEEFVNDIETILKIAYDISSKCPSNHCEKACYRCLLDYGNQRYHALLDRYIAVDVLNYIREGIEPILTKERQLSAINHLEYFAQPNYNLEAPIIHDLGEAQQVSRILATPEGARLSIWPIHTLHIPSEESLGKLARDMETIPIYISEFDLTVRPFWVWNQILSGLQGMIE